MGESDPWWRVRHSIPLDYGCNPLLFIFSSVERHDKIVPSCNEEREANDDQVCWLPHCTPQAPEVLKTLSLYKYQPTLLPQRGWGQTLQPWMPEYTHPGQHVDFQRCWKTQRKAFIWGKITQKTQANSLGSIRLPERCCLQSSVKTLSAVVLLS